MLNVIVLVNPCIIITITLLTFLKFYVIFNLFMLFYVAIKQ